MTEHSAAQPAAPAPVQGERAADADIESGRVSTFPTMDALIDDLHAKSQVQGERLEEVERLRAELAAIKKPFAERISIRDVPELSDDAADYIACTIEHDVRWVGDTEGMGRVRWTNEAVAMLLSDRNKLCSTVARLNSQLSGVQGALCDAGNVLAIREDGDYGASVRMLVEERDKFHARAGHLETWSGLMEVLDKHYPADVFDGSSGDPGARIVVLIRQLAAAQERVAALSEAVEAVLDYAGPESDWDEHMYPEAIAVYRQCAAALAPQAAAAAKQEASE